MSPLLARRAAPTVRLLLAALALLALASPATAAPKAPTPPTPPTPPTAPDAPSDEDDGLVTEVVTLSNIEPAEAAEVLRTLSSRRGRIQFSRELSVVTIVDRPALVEKMLDVLADLDKPRAALGLDIYLVAAGDERVGGRAPGAELEPVLGELRELFSYRSYSLLDRARIRMLAGRDAELEVGGEDGWKLEVSSRGQPTEDGRIGLDLHLYRPRTVIAQDQVKVLYDTVVSTSVETRDGETTVVGASRLDDGDQALITILVTRIDRP